MREPALKVEGGDDPRTAPFARPGDWQFRQLLEGLPAAAYTCDADGLITYFNRSAVQLWGRAPALNDPADRFCGSFRLFSPEAGVAARQPAVQRIWQVGRGGQCAGGHQ